MLPRNAQGRYLPHALDNPRYALSCVYLSLYSMPYVLAPHSMPHMVASLHIMSHTPVSRSVMLSTDIGLSSSLLSLIFKPMSIPSSYVITTRLLEVPDDDGWIQQGVQIFR
jgi:hypothetical protein